MTPRALACALRQLARWWGSPHPRLTRPVAPRTEGRVRRGMRYLLLSTLTYTRTSTSTASKALTGDLPIYRRPCPREARRTYLPTQAGAWGLIDPLPGRCAEPSHNRFKDSFLHPCPAQKRSLVLCWNPLPFEAVVFLSSATPPNRTVFLTHGFLNGAPTL